MKQRKDGSYEKKETIGHKPNGAPIRRTFRGKTPKEVRDKIKEYFQQSSYGTIDKKITLAEWADRWLEIYKEGNVKAITYESTYKGAVKKIKRYFKNARIADIRSVDIQAFYNSYSNMSQSFLNNLKITINAIFETAIKNELIVRNPAKSIIPKSNKAPREVRVYTREEAKKLFEFARNHKDGAPIITILKTGLRRGEMCALKWSDIDFKNNIIKVRHSLTMVHGTGKLDTPKTKSSIREIPFDNELKSILLQIPRDIHNSFVFLSPKGKMINPENWEKRTYANFMKEFSATGNRALRPHELRHTFGTFLYESTGSEHITAKIMGHSNTSITSKTYIHEGIEVKRAAIEKIAPYSTS